MIKDFSVYLEASGINVVMQFVAAAIAVILFIYGFVKYLKRPKTKQSAPETVPASLHKETAAELITTTKELATLQEAERQRRAQNPDQALEETKARLKELEAQLGNITPDEFPAKEALDKRDFKTAREEFEKLREAKQLDIEQAAEYEYALGLIAEEEIRWLDAAEHYAESSKLYENGDRLYKACEFYWKLGEIGKAKIYSDQLVDWSKANHGENSKWFAKALNSKGLLLNYVGKLEEAQPILEKSVEIGKTFEDANNDPEHAKHINNLAGVHRDMGENDRAKELYEEAITIGKATIGESHPEYAKHLNNLANVHRDLGEFDRAKALYEQAIKIDKSTIGENHPEHATRLNNLASVLENMGDLNGAKALYEQAIAIDKATIGENHPEYAIDLNNLAGVHRALGENDRAKELFEEALAIFKATLPADHPNIKITENNLDALNK